MGRREAAVLAVSLLVVAGCGRSAETGQPEIRASRALEAPAMPAPEPAATQTSVVAPRLASTRVEGKPADLETCRPPLGGEALLPGIIGFPARLVVKAETKVAPILPLDGVASVEVPEPDELPVGQDLPTVSLTVEQGTGVGLSRGREGIDGDRVVYKQKLLFHGKGEAGAEDQVYVYDPVGSGFRLLAEGCGDGEQDMFRGGKVYGNSLICSLRDCRDGKRKLFRYVDDPDRLEKIVDVAPDGRGEAPDSFTEFDGSLYFVARIDGEAERTKLFRYTEDVLGTPVAVRQISDLRPGLSDDIAGLVACGDHLFFTARNELGARKVFRYDPELDVITEITNTSGLRGIGDEPEELTVYGGQLAFRAQDQSGLTRLFLLDGAEGRVRQLTSLNAQGGDHPQALKVVWGQLLFAMDLDVGVSKLFRYDITLDEIVQVTDIAPEGGSDDIASVTAFGAEAVFTATTADGERALFSYDVAANLLKRVGDTWDGGSDDPSEMTVWGERLVFVSNSDAQARKVCVYDGVASSLLCDIQGDLAVSDAPSIAGQTDDLLFVEATRGDQESIYTVRIP